MAGNVKPINILVVEDEGIVARDIQHCLHRLGYNVPVIAATGEDAIRQAEELRPDLVLMDIVLKGEMGGTEAAQEIHRRFHIPVIFLTAYADDATLEKAKSAEPYGYITKPFEDTDLRIGVEMALYKAGMEAERRELTCNLQKALDEVKRLSGLIPICANCKKIRNDKGYWQAVESYISEHSEASFSHGICNECLHKLYPDIYPEQPG